MIRVTSYLKHEGRFVPVSEFRGTVSDPRYVEGAIVADVLGQELFTLEMWDYVDQLWAYLVEALVAISNGESFSMFMPDQPIEFQFSPKEHGSLRIVRRGFRNAEIVTKRDEFVRAFAEAASEFFFWMKSIVPENASTYETITRSLPKLGH